MTQEQCCHKSGTYTEDGIERCSGCKNAMVTIAALEAAQGILRKGDMTWRLGDNPSGADRIYHERARQQLEEKWTDEHDDEHIEEEMALAAALYASPTKLYAQRTSASGIHFVDPWPWDKCWDKREDTTRIRDLTKAGALIAAEIDRLQRQEAKEKEAAAAQRAESEKDLEPIVFLGVKEMEGQVFMIDNTGGRFGTYWLWKWLHKQKTFVSVREITYAERQAAPTNLTQEEQDLYLKISKENTP